MITFTGNAHYNFKSAGTVYTELLCCPEQDGGRGVRKEVEL